MKGSFTAEAGELASAIKHAARWIEARPVTPIYGGLLFRVTAGRLAIAGMSENASASAGLDVKGDASGAFVVAGRLVDQLVGTLSKRPVTFEQDGAIVSITSGSWRGTMPAMSEQDYPTLPEQAATAGTASGAALADAVTRIAKSAAPRADERTVFTGLHVSFDEEPASFDPDSQSGQYTLTFTASNAHQAARQSIPWEPDPDGAPLGDNALPFAHIMLDAIGAFEGDSEVAIGFERSGRGGGVLSMAGADRTLVMRTLGNDFPDMGPIFAVQGGASATFRPADLVVPLKRANLIDNDEYPQVSMRFTRDLLSLSAVMEGRGDSEEDVDGVAYDGEDCTFVVRAALLQSALSTTPGGEAVMTFTPNTIRPILITSPADPTWRHILKPLQNTRGK